MLDATPCDNLRGTQITAVESLYVYNGLAIAHKLAMHNVRGLQSESRAPSRGSALSIGTKCSPFCSPIVV
jgi:hypothetical protein